MSLSSFLLNKIKIRKKNYNSDQLTDRSEKICLYRLAFDVKGKTLEISRKMKLSHTLNVIKIYHSFAVLF